MKKFTKGALITALIFTVLGFTLCTVGAGIGFHYTSIPKMIREGILQVDSRFGHWGGHWNNIWKWNDWKDWTDDWDDDWESWSGAATEYYDFSAEECADIRNLNLMADYSSVEIEEAGYQQGIHIEVRYQKENSKRNINVYQDGNTLKIEENSIKKLTKNDNIYIKVLIPENMEFEKVDLHNSAGKILLNHALHAKDFSVIVGAGECIINQDLQIADTLYAEVDTGEISFEQIQAGKIELNTGVGEINVENAVADKVVLNCGVGELDITLDGREEDYSYEIDCGIGDVEIGKSSYSGLGATKKVHGGSKTVDINCGIGEVIVDFTK